MTFPVRRSLACVGLLVLSVMSSSCGDTIASAPVPDGATLAAEKGCVACHGVDGKATTPAFPNLSNQWARYLNLQLRAYRSGNRDNAVMSAQAAELTDQEIRILADHYGIRP